MVANEGQRGAGGWAALRSVTGSWRLGSVLNATSVAVLTYIGFDSISTLSEEVHNPRRNILYATVVVCLALAYLAAP